MPTEVRDWNHFQGARLHRPHFCRPRPPPTDVQHQPLGLAGTTTNNRGTRTHRGTPENGNEKEKFASIVNSDAEMEDPESFDVSDEIKYTWKDLVQLILTNRDYESSYAYESPS